MSDYYFLGSINHRVDNDAESLKQHGNGYFKNGQTEKAVDCYTKSLEITPTPACYVNRSVAYLKLKNFDGALQDATNAISIDKNYLMGYIRRGDAYMALRNYTLALQDYQRAIIMEPNHQLIKGKLKKCSEFLQRAGTLYKRCFKDEPRPSIKKI